MAQAYTLLTRKRLNLDENVKIYKPRRRVREEKERRKDKLTRAQETGHQRQGVRTRETVHERQRMRDGCERRGMGHERMGARDRA